MTTEESTVIKTIEQCLQAYKEADSYREQTNSVLQKINALRLIRWDAEKLEKRMAQYLRGKTYKGYKS